MEKERQKWKGQKRLKLNLELYQLLTSELPIEIGFEIFGHLHPIDLFHLAYVSKSLRSLVMTRDTGPLWKIAFLRHPELPRRPPELSEPKWATLLFEPASCYDRDSEVVLVDFASLRYSCSDCMRQNNVHRVVVHRADDTAWDLILCTLRTEALKFCDSGWNLDAEDFRKYVNKDFLRVASRLECLQDVVGHGNPGSLEALEAFKRSTGNNRAARLQYAFTCNSWAEDFQLQLRRNIAAEANKSFARLVKLCVGQGHEKRDAVTCLGRNDIYPSFKT